MSEATPKSTDRRPLMLTAVYAMLWVWLWFDWIAWYQLPDWVKMLGFTASLPVIVYWVRRAWAMRSPVRRWAVLSVCYVPASHWMVYATYTLALDEVRVIFARVSIGGVFVIGLLWAVWYVERASQRILSRRRAAAERRGDRRIWNPLDLDAWYYGQRVQRLNQSLTTLVAYSLAFLVLFLLLNQVAGCKEIYEMPAGGGEQKQLQQVVKVQKVIRKKFVINPYSAIVFNPPPIDDVKLQLLEITKHAYTVGYGQGTGAGFAGGTNRGKVRFIRLEYDGGDWDQDMGVGADLNLLIEYGVRTGQKVAEQTESRKIVELRNFPKGKSPPMVYMTGQRSISLSKSEVEILREYLLDKHGMIFADNGGSSGWHSQFFNLMRKVLPQVEPVKVPLDDVVHRVPYAIPFLPYVAPHGGKDAWGWKVDGRWVVYYHPGDIGDAWADGHAGVKHEVWEACYQLGVNVVFYAHAEYNKWLDARGKAGDKE
ncbi:MAG: DUF4159 domain-containing protein [Phycisphaera sp.]|nr:DUF4159 domain-containing protein [Phycisphaera sp.]